MRKFTSILCALVIALSAAAAPGPAIGKITEAQLQKTVQQDAKAKKTVEWNATRNSATADAPEVYNLTMATATLTYYKTGSDIAVEMADAEGKYAFNFDIKLPAGQRALESGKTYTLDDMEEDSSFGEDLVKQDYIYYASVQFTQTVAADGSYTIAAVVVDKSGNTWNVNYTYTKPAPPSEYTNVKIGIVEKEYRSNLGLVVYQLVSEDNTSTFVFAIYLEDGQQDTEIDKTYTLSDMMTSYAYRETATSKKLFADATFTKSLYDEGLVRIVADVITDDGAYHVVYEEPKSIPPTGETINVVINRSFNMTYYNSSKDWYIVAENDNYKLCLDFYSNSSESPAGTYNSENEDFDLNYTYLIKKGETSTKINTSKAKATITLEDKKLKLEAIILGKDGIVYAATALYDEAALAYDESSADFAEDFAEYTLDDRNFDKYDGELDVTADNDNNAGISLVFYCTTKTLAAGEYPVANTGAVGTVLASIGLDRKNYPRPSFVGYQTTDSYTHIWFFAAGKVTVDAQGNINVDATNSVGRTIKCRLAAKNAPAAVEAVKDETMAVKSIVNGQVVIEKNGVRYNLLGTAIK